YILCIINIHLHARGHRSYSAIHQRSQPLRQLGLQGFWCNKNLMCLLRALVLYHCKAVKSFGIESYRVGPLVRYITTNNFMRKNGRGKVVWVRLRAVLRQFCFSGVSIDTAKKQAKKEKRRGWVGHG